MQNSQQKTQEQQTEKQVQKQAENRQTTVYQCPNCGAAHAEGDKFCAECGMGLKGNTCAHCGAETQPNWEICPACGHNLQAELCSFCGGAMDAGSAFCPECGNPRTGIICPSCQTLNFRSFCRKCNTPLNALAQEALEEARNDPKVQQAIAIAQELAELEEYLLSQDDGDDDTAPPEIAELSNENKQLVNQYKDLLASLGVVSLEKKEGTPKTEAPKPAAKPKKTFSISIANKEEAMKKYKEKLGEMQALLSSMIPDAGMTPQLQRDFYSARKVEIVTRTKVKVPLYWICNAYGCQHSQPNECAEPFKGGKWVYDERDEVTSTWVSQ